MSTGAQVYRRLISYLAPYKTAFAGGVIGMVLVASTEPLFPWMLQQLLDRGFAQRDPRIVWAGPLALVVLFIFRGMLTFATAYSVHWVSQRVLLDLRRQMFDRLAQLPTPFFDNNASAGLISRIISDVNNVTQAATHVLTVLVRDSAVIIGLTAYLLWLNWRLTLVTLVMLPMVALVVRVFSSRLRRASRGSQQATENLTHVLQESIELQKVIKIYGGQAMERERFDAANNAFRGFQMRTVVASAATVPITQLLASLALAVVIYIGLSQAINADATVGGFVGFVTAMLMLLAPLKNLSDINTPLQRGIAAAESAFAVIDQLPEDDGGTKTIERASGQIRFEGVTLHYGDAARPVLRDIALDIPAGQTIALVGPSGGGKTSLVNLIPRFYHASAGQILVDGVPIESLTLASLRQQIAMVSQDVVLFNDTMANNIAYGANRGAGIERIEWAARAANLWTMIQDLPEGLQTMVGENGVRLSGGQRQRLAIARAFIKDAPILILDEATSALDNESERLVQQAIETLMQNRTTVVIAHRLSTIQNADRIVVLESGRIVETGRHSELLEAGGVYSALYRLQLQAP